MPFTTLHAVSPIDRFRQVCRELGVDRSWLIERAWLRVAARAAVISPDDPRDIARSITKALGELRLHLGWTDSLQTPFGQLVAASLVQIRDSPADFLWDLVSALKILHLVDIPHSNWCEMKAVLALRLLSDGQDISFQIMRRLLDIAMRMRSRHWWLSGRDDLPNCALLTACPGEPSDICNNADAIYRELSNRGVLQRERLQVATSILQLARLDPVVIANRYLAVSIAIAETGLPLEDENFLTEAMLALLDHAPETIASSLKQIYNELKTGNPLDVPVDLSVAAELCFLDLVGADCSLRRLSSVTELVRVQDRIRQQSAIAVAIEPSQPTPIQQQGLPWR